MLEGGAELRCCAEVSLYRAASTRGRWRGIIVEVRQSMGGTFTPSEGDGGGGSPATQTTTTATVE